MFREERAHCLHFLVGVHQPPFQGLERIVGNGFDVGDDVFNSFGREGAENKLSKFGMVGSLVKEDSFFPQHPLFTCWECWLKQMSPGHQHKFHGFRA